MTTTSTPTPRRVNVLGLFVFLVLILGGIALIAVGSTQRFNELRGWTDPTTSVDVPNRVPLAGVNVELTQYDAAGLDRELGRIAADGFVWVRQTFLWSTIEAQQGVYNFSTYDPIVAAVGKTKNLRIVAVLDSAPVWARRREASAADRMYAPPANMSTFGAFAGAFAAHYKDQIDIYQIWDEPNLNTHWGGLDPNPADYAAMLSAASTAIRANDSTSTILTAGLAPTVERGPRNVSDVLFLRGMYEAGARNSFDAVAGKPYGFDSGPEDRTVSEETLNFSHIILLREEMVRQGDGQKLLWASHFGWNSLPTDWKGQKSIWGQTDAETQGRYTRAAYERAAREWPWMGGMMLMGWQPPITDNEAITGFDVSQKAAGWFANGAFFATPTFSPGVYAPTDSRIVYSNGWRFGPLGADVEPPTQGDPAPDGSDRTLKFTFEGDSVAFKVRRAEYVAYLYISVDGKPANALPRNASGDAFILMRSPDFNPKTEMITAARGLGAGVHTVEARLYLGFTRWPIAGIAIGAALPDVPTARFNLLIIGGIAVLLIGVIGAVLVLRRVPREPIAANVRSIRTYVGRMADVFGGIVLSALALAGVALTVGNMLPGLLKRDLPAFALTVLAAGLLYFAPILILTILAAAALWVLIFNRPLIGLALNIFWVPFFLQPVDLHVYALPMSELCIYLTASAVLVRALVDWGMLRRTKPASAQTATFFALDGLMVGFVALAVLSLTWSEQLTPAIRELRVIVVFPVMFYALIRLIRPNREDLLRLVDVFLLSGLAVAVIGLVGFVSGRFGVTIAESGSRRLMSVYSSANNAALFLGRCLPFAVAMFLILPRGVRKAFAGGVSLILLAAILLTQSAGALLLGLPVSLAVVAILWDRRKGLIVIFVLAILFGGVLLASRFVPRLQGVFDFSRSTSFVRTQVWTSALNLLRERPLTGAGLDQFLYLYRSRYILPDAWAEPNLSHPHDVFLDFWIRLGILGLMLLISFQFFFWRTAWRTYRRAKADPLLMALTVGAMGSMANFLAHGLVDNSYFVLDLSYIFCFTLALVVQTHNLSRDS